MGSLDISSSKEVRKEPQVGRLTINNAVRLVVSITGGKEDVTAARGLGRRAVVIGFVVVDAGFDGRSVRKGSTGTTH